MLCITLVLSTVISLPYPCDANLRQTKGLAPPEPPVYKTWVMDTAYLRGLPLMSASMELMLGCLNPSISVEGVIEDGGGLSCLCPCLFER